MQWENLTSLDFERAVNECNGVGILPIGVLEPHASHLPIGTDMFVAHWMACRAAEQVPAIVFPAYPYGINIESAHLPGSLVIRREIVFALLENICDEMGRHGLNKIVLLNGHGGNRFFLPLFVQTLPEKNKPYVAYFTDLPYFPGADEVIETKETGHACEAETSLVLYIHEELVKMGQIPPNPFTSLRRNQSLTQVGAYSPVDWYAMYPAMYVGDASKATADKGKIIMGKLVKALVALLRVVKEDSITPALFEEFQARMHKPASPALWKSTN
jgi:creatinine amidohydrolase